MRRGRPGTSGGTARKGGDLRREVEPLGRATSLSPAAEVRLLLHRWRLGGGTACHQAGPSHRRQARVLAPFRTGGAGDSPFASPTAPQLRKGGLGPLVPNVGGKETHTRTCVASCPGADRGPPDLHFPLKSSRSGAEWEGEGVDCVRSLLSRQ